MKEINQISIVNQYKEGQLVLKRELPSMCREI
jgi:hypothetical protein